MSDEPPVEGWPDESAQRLEKASALRGRGIDPYPNRFAISTASSMITDAGVCGSFISS